MTADGPSGSSEPLGPAPYSFLALKNNRDMFPLVESSTVPTPDAPTVTG